MKGHRFDPLTRFCSCGTAEVDMLDRNPPSHDDALNPGTVEAVYRQRSTGRSIIYRRAK